MVKRGITETTRHCQLERQRCIMLHSAIENAEERVYPVFRQLPLPSFWLWEDVLSVASFGVLMFVENDDDSCILRQIHLLVGDDSTSRAKNATWRYEYCILRSKLATRLPLSLSSMHAGLIRPRERPVVEDRLCQNTLNDFVPQTREKKDTVNSHETSPVFVSSWCEWEPSTSIHDYSNVFIWFSSLLASGLGDLYDSILQVC